MADNDNQSLEKGIKGAIAAASMAMTPAATQAQNLQPTEQTKQTTEPPKTQPLNPDLIHPEMKPIFQLESSGGKNLEHKPGPGGELDTAAGPLGLKPKTAHDEYSRSKSLQKLYPNLQDINALSQAMKENPHFYSAVAASHWNRLKNTHGTSEKAAFAWRWGSNAASKVSDISVKNDPYVRQYLQLLGKSEDLDKAEPKTISSIKPGKMIGQEAKAKTYNYDHILSPTHIKHGYDLKITDYGDNLHATLNRGRELVGNLVFQKHPKLPGHMQVDAAIVQEKHRGQGLGQSLYEAAYAHGKHKLNTSFVMGGEHSTGASAVHQKLAQKYGLNYRLALNPEGAPIPGPFDKRFAPYRYEIKAEENIDKMEGGRAQGRSPAEFDPEQLEIGTKHEMEHTKDRKIAQQIAMDHLTEDPDYYKKLKEIEKSEFDLSKAIADIKPGKMIGQKGQDKIYDYTHVLHPDHQKAGYSMHLEHAPDNTMTLWMKHPGSFLEPGVLQASFNPHNRTLHPETADIHPDHQGKGLGQSMYEALMTHGKHILGATHVGGEEHSTMASRVHQKLSQKHGMGYMPVKNPKPANVVGESHDKKFGSYKYALKTEEFSKSLEEWASMAKTPEKIKVIHYSHIPNIKELDPKMQGTGLAKGAERSRPNRVPRTYVYKSNAETESCIDTSEYKYQGEIPDMYYIYNFAKDPLGLLEPELTKSENGILITPRDLDEVERYLVRQGYAGYSHYNSNCPNAIALFVKVPVKRV